MDNPSRGKGGRHASLKLLGAGLIAGAVSFSAGPGYTDESEFSARLSGFNEIGSIPITTPAAGSPTGYTGAVLSDGTGTVKLDLNGNSITCSLTYSDVGTRPPNTGTVTQAHIHFGKSRDSGGVMVFFCSNLGNGPAGTPKCPPNSGTVAGTWTAASVVGPAAQNIEAGKTRRAVGRAEFEYSLCQCPLDLLPSGRDPGTGS